MTPLWASVAVAALLGCQHQPPLTELRAHETEAIARDFMHIQYDQRDVKGAKAKYYTPDFIQHNPEIGNGASGDQKFIEARHERDPTHFLPVSEWVNKVDHVLVDGKLFAIHHRLYTSPQDTGRVFMDIWRVENGKMVEHWDIIQPIPATAKNDNTMWTDVTAPSTSPADGPSPELVIRDYMRIGLEGHDPAAAAQKYIAEDFHQHSPHIPDGKAALIDYFRERSANQPTRTSYVSHILADHDLVLVTRHTVTGPNDPGVMYADLFRVRRGLIVEHWDVIQEVPAQSVNGNKMW